jgi:hypothetical protein
MFPDPEMTGKYLFGNGAARLMRGGEAHAGGDAPGPAR